MTFQIPNLLGPIAPPPANAWGVGATAAQALLIGSRFQGEMTSPAKYSKFAADSTQYDDPIPGKQGMFFAYAPATAVSLYQFVVTSNLHNVAAGLLFLHFLKRTLEVLFLHSFGGTMSRNTSFLISTFYSLDTLLVSSFALNVPDIDPTFMTVGIVLFAIGELGNFYHHYLLTTLRKDRKKSSQRYVAPKGGLFEYVAMPHYLFELISWLGIAFCAQQLNGFLEVLSHTSYLMGRAYQTNQLYFKTFSDVEWPRSRKNIFPYLY